MNTATRFIRVFIVLGIQNFEPYQNCQFQYVCESSQSQGGKGRGVEFGSTQWNFASSGFWWEKWSIVVVIMIMIIILHTKQNPWITYLLVNPSLNTQSCIKGLLVAWDLCFLAVWAAGPVHKRVGGRLWTTFEDVSFTFLRSKFF